MNAPIKSPNYQAARQLAELISRERDPNLTFQVFDDSKDNPDPSLAAWRYGKLSDNAIHRFLETKANQGCGIYWTPNVCDGTGRRLPNVKHALSVFADFDGVALPTKWPLQPHAIVETSRGKFHVYWNIEPTTDLAAWSDCQARVAAFFGSDPNVHDAPRVLRLPGFFHQKGAPVRVKIISADAHLWPYTLEQVAAAHPCEYVAPAKHSADRHRSNEPVAGWDRDEDVTHVKALISKREKPTEGTRNNEAFKVAALLNDFAISPDMSLEVLTEWNEGVGLPDHELEHVIRSAPAYKHSGAGSQSLPDAADEFDDDYFSEDDKAKFAESKRKKVDRYRPYTRTELLALASPKWLVEGVLIQGGLFEIYGKFKSGKTFWGIEMAACIATGLPFFGAKTTQGKVLYVIAEGNKKMFGFRIEYWIRERAGDDKAEYARLAKLIDDNLQVVPVAVHMDMPEEVDAFIKRNPGERAAVFVDTLFRNMAGDPIKPADMSKFINGCAELKLRMNDTSVVFLHHEKRDNAKGAFGSVVGEAGVDGAANVHTPEKNETWFHLVIMRDSDTNVPPWKAHIEPRAIDVAEFKLGETDVKNIGVLVFDDQSGHTQRDMLLFIARNATKPDAKTLAADWLGSTDRNTAVKKVQRLVKDARKKKLIHPDTLTLTEAGKAHVGLIDAATDFEGQ